MQQEWGKQEKKIFIR